MKETTSKRKGGWFWVGVILLTLLLLIFIPIIVAEPSIFIIIFALVLLTVPVVTIIYGIMHGRKVRNGKREEWLVSEINRLRIVVAEVTAENLTLKRGVLV